MAHRIHHSIQVHSIPAIRLQLTPINQLAIRLQPTGVKALSATSRAHPIPMADQIQTLLAIHHHSVAMPMPMPVQMPIISRMGPMAAAHHLEGSSRREDPDEEEESHTHTGKDQKCSLSCKCFYCILCIFHHTVYYMLIHYQISPKYIHVHTNNLKF
jgi:hypothetical protein